MEAIEIDKAGKNSPSKKYFSCSLGYPYSIPLDVFILDGFTLSGMVSPLERSKSTYAINQNPIQSQ